MQKYSMEPMSLTSLPDWQIIYERVLNQLSSPDHTGMIDANQNKTFRDFLEEINQGIRYYFKLTVLPQKTGQLHNLSKKLKDFLKAKSQLLPTNPALAMLSSLVIMLNNTSEELLNLKHVPPEIMQFLADSYLDAKLHLAWLQLPGIYFLMRPV